MNREEREAHLDEVEQWLDDNVQVFETPKTVTVRDFDVDTVRCIADFRLVLDGVAIDDRFHFSIQGEGWPHVFYPILTSPLGAPASYASVELINETSVTLRRLAAGLIPRLKPFGLDRQTGELVFNTTHGISDRVRDRAAHEAALAALQAPGFEVSLDVDPTPTLFTGPDSD